MNERVVLLRDARWPLVPGVCCWRQAVQAAFGELGARVEEATWSPPAIGPPAPPARRSARLVWLPSPLRSPLARLYRAGRALRLGLRRRWRSRSRSAATRNRAVWRDLAGVTLVIAESIEAATDAVAGGVPGQRVWALALPPERLHPGDDTGFAGAVARAAPVIGGFLTGSEPARDSLERAACASRPRVEIFPPVAADRPCPDHVPAPAAGDAAGPAGPALAPALPVPSPLVPWYGGTAEAVSGLESLPEPEPADASAATQHRAATRVWEVVSPPAPRPPRPARGVLVTGFDLKFARDLADRLGARGDLDVVVDAWPTLAHPGRRTGARLRRAGSVFAEWAHRSAVWCSHHKRPGQLLVIRLHRYELESAYPRDIAIENVDAVVYIAPLFGRRIRDELGWPAEKLVYIPNLLDLDWLDRPKLPEARYAIGFVGLEWSRKRFDLALDLLARLRREDPRFTMRVRSTMPWHNPYVWADPHERAYTGWCFEKIERDPLLRQGVTFDTPGRDMARWFRQVGYVLSTSDREGSHAAVTEGMAAGSVPIVRPWPGAGELYGHEWLHATVDDAVGAVLAPGWAEQSARARAEVRQTHDPRTVVAAWADLLHGDLPAARGHFEAYSGLPDPPAVRATPAPSPRRPAPVPAAVDAAHPPRPRPEDERGAA